MPTTQALKNKAVVFRDTSGTSVKADLRKVEVKEVDGKRKKPAPVAASADQLAKLAEHFKK